jgi:DsbC/DsbD-like thiol-disulfide interchange protein
MMRGIFLILSVGIAWTTFGSVSPAQEAKARRSDAVVKVSAEAGKPDADGKQTLTVTFKIDENWHIYANTLPKDFPGVPTSIKVNAQSKVQDVKVDYPEGKWIKEGEYNAYEGTVPIKVTLQRSKGDTSPLEVTVAFQSCTKTTCLFPATVKQTVP